MNAKENINEQNKKLTDIDQQQREAQAYILDLVSHREAVRRGEAIETNAFWQEMLLNIFKEKAIEWVGQALEELINKGRLYEWAKNLAFWLLGKLEDILINKYNSTQDGTTKHIFKEVIVKNFPESKLAKAIN